MRNEKLTPQVWQSKYLAAILEVDNATLLQRVAEAEMAIGERLKAIAGQPDHDEMAAIQDAMRGLKVLRTERLG